MKRIVLICICLSVMVAGSVLVGQPVTLLLNVQTPPLPWGESELYHKLNVRLTRDQAFRIVRADDNLPGLPNFPRDRFNIDSLLDWAQEAGGRYLMVVTVESERIVREKSFNIPLIFHKWQTKGIIEGEYRLYDVMRGKQLQAEPFKVELDGPRVFQGSMDDDKFDPDIHLSAVEKLTFISRLEDLLAEKLTARYMHGMRNP